MMSSVGNVVSPSLIATLQSAGAGGYGLATVYPAVQAFGGTLAAISGGGVAWTKWKSA